MYWQDLTEEQKLNEYNLYLKEVETKHIETIPMTYEQFCMEWNDCTTIIVKTR